MDGRLAQSVTRLRRRPAASRGRLSRALRRVTLPLAHLRLPRFAGLAATLVFLTGAGTYAVVKGGHVAVIATAIKDTADAAANAMGMRIATVSLSGQRQVSREEIFAAAGVTDHSSLLFLDVADARTRLEAIPWIAEAGCRSPSPSARPSRCGNATARSR
jgi:cell division septal protein FtsQ